MSLRYRHARRVIQAVRLLVVAAVVVGAGAACAGDADVASATETTQVSDATAQDAAASAGPEDDRDLTDSDDEQQSGEMPASGGEQPEDEQQTAEEERKRRAAEEQEARDRAASEASAPDPCAPESLPGTGADMARTITSGGHEYQYLVYVPGGLDGPAPLVLNFHGLGGDGPGQARYTGYRELAEREGFVVIHPSGLLIDGSQGLRSWELAQEAGLNAELDAERDDLRFVRDLLDEVTAQYCIDPERIYSTGMSNGGGFSSRLACELADRIAAAFAVTLVTHPESCEPSQALAFAAVHGTADDIVPFYGTGESPVAGLARTAEEREAFREFFSQVMPDELAEFAADFNCVTVSTSTIGAATTLTTYADCDDGVEARFYAIEGFGHEWPSLPGDDFSATEEGWAFMSSYTLSNSAD